MPKKIFVIIFAVLLIIGGGFFAYERGYFTKSSEPKVEQLGTEKLLNFEIKDTTLTPEVIQRFQGQYENLKKNLQQNPDDFNSWITLGILKKDVNDYEGARDIFIYAGQIRPQSSPPFANLADLYANFLNEPLKAEENIKKAIENDPGDYNFYVTLADIYRYKIPGKEVLYEQTLLDALNKFPDEVNIISLLASYYRQTNQREKAIQFYEKLVKLNPNNITAKQDLEELKSIENNQ
jgi:cytochrome c-type biogenesis protein CcmH/NrfG